MQLKALLVLFYDFMLFLTHKVQFSAPFLLYPFVMDCCNFVLFSPAKEKVCKKETIWPTHGLARNFPKKLP